MGSSYTNITLHGPEHARIVQALEARRRQAYVGPQTDGFVVVFDEGIDDDPQQAPALARELSAELRGVALAATVHDDDIFLYTLVRDGEVLDEYDSRPGYPNGKAPPSGGNAELLASTFGAGNAAAVERILRAPAKDGEYLFESARHADLAEVLGLPGHSVGFGYNYVFQGDAEELEGDLTTVGNPDEETFGAGGHGAAGQGLFPGLPPMPGVQMAGVQMAREHFEAMNATAGHPAHGYFAALLAGDAQAVRALFAGEPVLDDPVSGRVNGAGLDAHVAAAHALFAAGTPHYMPMGMIETPGRTVGFGQIFDEAEGGLTVLACACVCERAGDGGFRELRAYWAPAALKGQRGERAPVVQPDAGVTLPEPVAAHLKALAADDVDAVVATYDPATLAPVPLPWLDPGDTVRRDYGAQVGQEGAVVLSPCIVTATDAACAVEFVTTRWDGADVPAQAGLAIYDLRGGRIGGVRLYGDLAPSPLAGLESLTGGMGGMDPFGAGGGLGALGGMPGLGDLGAMGGAMDLSPEAMQAAMDEVMKMMSGPGGLAGMMENLQKMMGGLGGLGGMPPGMGGLSGEGAQGMPDLNALFGGFPPAAAGGHPDDEADDPADEAEPAADDAPDAGGADASGTAPK